MSTLTQIKKQIEELQQKAAEIQMREKEAVLAEIRQKIIDFEITPEDLGLQSNPGTRRRSSSAAPKKAPAEAKYRNSDGLTWSGGRGRKPRWVQEIIDGGGDIEKYRIKGKK